MAPVARRLPAIDAAGDFPELPPDPYAAAQPPLPPLDDELWHHGGSYLYIPEGDRLNWPPPHADEHYEVLRLPETWEAPRPLTWFSDFLGADPIYSRPHLKWFGHDGYLWDVRLVGYGNYQLFALALEENDRRQDAIGHQLSLDLDLRLTGTERFHVQFRPLGDNRTGGSFYQFSNPAGYENNAQGTPNRYWFEGELQSIFGAYLDPFTAMDFNFVAGKFPFALHNTLLIDDEIQAVAVGKNSIYAGRLSNLNVQAFYAWNDVNTLGTGNNRLAGVNAVADYRHTFYEATYAMLQHPADDRRDAHYVALSRTRFYGPVTLAGRALFKIGDTGGRGSGQLFVLESSYTRALHENRWGVEKGVFYCNAFLATPGWNPISGSNLNRLRATFETNPLVRIAAGIAPDDQWGAAVGVQLFRHHADESLVPELAFQEVQGEPVIGFGLRYLRKVGSRAFFETLATLALADDPRFDREGVFLSYTVLF